MKISTNAIGNYKPVIQKQNIQTKQSLPEKTEPKITLEEKKFFSNLYPEDAEKIEKYNFYDRDGAMKGFSLGSLIDRRG